jgi:hypothetical protein
MSLVFQNIPKHLFFFMLMNYDTVRIKFARLLFAFLYLHLHWYILFKILILPVQDNIGSEKFRTNEDSLRNTIRTQCRSIERKCMSDGSEDIDLMHRYK